MSWFDTSGFASLAKSALKEAQKTIDKALDIKDEEQKQGKQVSSGDSSDFFASWGLKNEEGENEKTIPCASQQKMQQHHQQQVINNSIWGSFTGSFFENPKTETSESSNIVRQSKSLEEESKSEKNNAAQLTSSSSMPENIVSQNIKCTIFPSKGDNSKLITETVTAGNPKRDEQIASFINEDKEIMRRKKESRENWMIKDKKDGKNRRWSSEETYVDGDKRNFGGNTKRVRESNTNYTVHRISVLSSESDKRSSESVEILGSQSSTTSPDSESINLVGLCSSSSSSSSAMCLKVNSESVEILPDSSMTSPSSVEILEDCKSDSSPYLSPLEQKHFETSSCTFEYESCEANISDSPSKQNQCQEMSASCSDISPYESPSEEIKTPNTDKVVNVFESSLNEGLLNTTSSATLINELHKDSIKTLPESVEVIADVDESDEISLAEDSYTSASESTVMTIMETRQQDLTKMNVNLTEGNLKMHDSCPNSRQFSASTSLSDYSLNLSLDSLKERQNTHLSIEPTTTITQIIRKPDVKKVPDIDPFDQLKNSTIEPSDSCHRFDNSREINETINEGTDQYLMLTDSSCEGTLIESSSEDNATMMGASSQSKLPEAPLSTSSYVKSMLADAMSEKSEITDPEKQCMDVPRENSPISSESRSDLVKIGSDQTSGHTSGDELETTTSSDIEIISRHSPNGDSSSTQSRQSPAKLQLSKSSDLLTRTLKTRGHSRELSEISVGSDDANLEIEKLLKRIQEMTEILEARESKLIDVSRMNMELHEQNNSLKKQLDNVEKHAEHSQDLSQITDEYTQRLSALERKFQQAIRERDTLRKNLEQLKQETASRLSSSLDMSTSNAEKDETIKELREEGEKLSKQQLQHSNIIKKLRAKEKENDAMLKNQKEQIEEQNLELDRLKRSLYAKEEVERSQIEAVHTLTAKTKKQEKEILSLQEKLDNAINKMDVYKKSLDAAKTELTEITENLRTAENELTRVMESAGESYQLSAQIEDLKIKLRHAEESCIRKEESLKQENLELLKRLEAAESRNEELSESASTATKPLLRQLEQLQANLLHKTNNFMKQERIMSDKIIELQSKLESTMQSNQSLKEQNLTCKSNISSLESKLNSKNLEREKLLQLNEELKTTNEKIVEKNERFEESIKMLEESHLSQVKELKREINSLENKLAIEKAATDAEKRKNHAILESQQQSMDEELRLSPTLSIERDSVSSANSVWQVFNDPMFESTSGRFPNVYDSLRSGSNNTSIIENLQAQLKQREGEIQQLQWELCRRNSERDALNGELSSLSLKVEVLNNKVVETEALKENLNDIQTKYDALLQMYGEKVEENQELRLDLQDVKEMYKTQIDQLLKRDV